MDFRKLLDKQDFTLIMSLPSNDLALAQAALEGGAQAIKVHCNVSHRASGHTFGSFSQVQPFLKELRQLCGETPLGLVPGAADHFITPGEYRQLSATGVDFISAYAAHLPVFCLEDHLPQRMVALDHRCTDGLLKAVSQADYVDVLECSFMEGADYGKPLTAEDLLRYRQAAALSGKPCIVPTQKAILPQELRHLYQAGIKGIMIGAVVLGQDPTPHTLREITRAYRSAMDAL